MIDKISEFVSTEKARREFCKLTRRCEKGAVVAITRNSKVPAVMMGYDEYLKLINHRRNGNS